MAGRPRNRDHHVPVDEVIYPEHVLSEQWRLETLLPVIHGTEEAIQWLAKRGLLKNQQMCHLCFNHMTVSGCTRHIDGKRWKCPGKCNTTKSIRDESWFGRSKLTLNKIIQLLYFWCMEFPEPQMARELDVSRMALSDWMNFIREVCEEDLRLHPQQVGGLDDQTGEPITVEIDETKYFYRRFHEGRWREGHWVFGGVERGSGKCFMVEVPDRTRATLEPIVLKYVLPGTHIISDSRRGYGNLAQLGGGIYMHDEIMHGQPVADKNIHTKNIRSTWLKTKRKLGRLCGAAEELFPSYLCEYLWRNKYRNDEHCYFSRLLTCIREQYVLMPFRNKHDDDSEDDQLSLCRDEVPFRIKPEDDSEDDQLSLCRDEVLNMQDHIKQECPEVCHE